LEIFNLINNGTGRYQSRDYRIGEFGWDPEISGFRTAISRKN